MPSIVLFRFDTAPLIFWYISLHSIFTLMRRYNEWRSLPSAWNLRFLLPYSWAPLIIYQGLTASLIGESGSFALPAFLSQSTLTHILQWTMLPCPGNLLGNPTIYLILFSLSQRWKLRMISVGVAISRYMGNNIRRYISNFIKLYRYSSLHIIITLRITNFGTFTLVVIL